MMRFCSRRVFRGVTYRRPFCYNPSLPVSGSQVPEAMSDVSSFTDESYSSPGDLDSSSPAINHSEIDFTTNRAQTAFHYAYSVIKPLFQWYSMDMPTDPTLYTFDCQHRMMQNMLENQDLIEKMRETFKKEGLVYLTNTGLTSLQDMQMWTTILCENQIKYTGGANPRKPIESNVYDVGAPGSAWLHFHHEMAYVSKSPLSISLFCKHALPGERGWTYVSDAVKTTDEIMTTELGKKLQARGICYIRNLTDKAFYDDKDQSGIYNHWQDSFGTENWREVAPIAEERGLKVEWIFSSSGERFCKTKYYVSAFEYCPSLDQNVLYSSVADDYMWFDSWPGIDTTDVHARPLKLTYGDDSELTQEDRQTYVDVHDKYGFPVKWQPGDVVILCNYRWAHGRPAFYKEDHELRELGVVLGGTFDRVGCKPEKSYGSNFYVDQN